MQVALLQNPWHSLNPRNILEASDGSDDDFDGLPSSATAPIQVDSNEDEVEIIEKSEDDDEAELGLYLLSFLKLSSEIFILVRMSKKSRVCRTGNPVPGAG